MRMSSIIECRTVLTRFAFIKLFNVGRSSLDALLLHYSVEYGPHSMRFYYIIQLRTVLNRCFFLDYSV